MFIMVLALICEIEWKNHWLVFNNVGIFNTFDNDLWNWLKEAVISFY